MNILLNIPQGSDFLYDLFAKGAPLHSSEDVPYYFQNFGLAGLYVLLLVIAYFVFFKKKKDGFQLFVKTVLFTCTVLGGVFVYYIGYHVNEPDLSFFVKGFLALFSTARLFILGNDLVEVHEHVNANFYLWFSVFSVSAALISTSILVNLVGKNLKLWLRVVFSSSDEVYVFLGLNEAGYSLAKDIKRKNAKPLVVFVKNVSPNEDISLESSLEGVGALVMSSTSFFGSLNLHHEEFLFQPNLQSAHVGHIKSFNLKGNGLKRKIKKCTTHLFVLTENEDLNFHLSQILIEDLRGLKLKIKVDIHIRTFSKNMSEIYDDILKQDKDIVRYHLHNQSYIAAAQLVSDNLPLKWILKNDPECIQDACVKHDFSLAIVGFGFTGSAALRKFYEHGRFVGSNFKAILLDQSMKEREGEFIHRFNGMYTDLKDYLEFHELKANTLEFYALLDKKATELDYIVVSLGSDELNIKVAHDIQHVMNKVKSNYRIFVQVSNSRFYKRNVTAPDDTICVFGREKDVFTEEIIVKGYIERIAKQIHEHYNASAPEDKRIDWEKLTDFTKQSNISAAEHVITKMLLGGFKNPTTEMANLSDFNIVNQLRQYTSYTEFEQVLGEVKVLNLGKSEHLRWNAFHFANGWTKWNLDEIPEGSIKSKDEQKKIHACLVDWTELKKVSERFNENFEKYDLDGMSVLFKNAQAGLYDLK